MNCVDFLSTLLPVRQTNMDNGNITFFRISCSFFTSFAAFFFYIICVVPTFSVFRAPFQYLVSLYVQLTIIVRFFVPVLYVFLCTHTRCFLLFFFFCLYSTLFSLFRFSLSMRFCGNVRIYVWLLLRIVVVVVACFLLL